MVKPAIYPPIHSAPITDRIIDDHKIIEGPIAIRDGGIDNDMTGIITRERIDTPMGSTGFIASEGYIQRINPIPRIIDRPDGVIARIITDIRRIWMMITIAIGGPRIA